MWWVQQGFPFVLPATGSVPHPCRGVAVSGLPAHRSQEGLPHSVRGLNAQLTTSAHTSAAFLSRAWLSKRFDCRNYKQDTDEEESEEESEEECSDEEEDEEEENDYKAMGHSCEYLRGIYWFPTENRKVWRKGEQCRKILLDFNNLLSKIHLSTWCIYIITIQEAFTEKIKILVRFNLSFFFQSFMFSILPQSVFYVWVSGHFWTNQQKTSLYQCFVFRLYRLEGLGNLEIT